MPGAPKSSGSGIPVRIERAVPPPPVLGREDPVARLADGNQVAPRVSLAPGIDLDQQDRLLAAWAAEPPGFAPGSHRMSLPRVPGIRMLAPYGRMSRAVQRDRFGSGWGSIPACGDASGLAGRRSRAGTDIRAGPERAVALTPLVLREHSLAIRTDCRQPEPVGSGIPIHADREDDDAPTFGTKESGIRSPGAHGIPPAKAMGMRTNVLILAVVKGRVQRGGEIGDQSSGIAHPGAGDPPSLPVPPVTLRWRHASRGKTCWQSMQIATTSHPAIGRLSCSSSVR
jgi:hypothetical protein